MFYNNITLVYLSQHCFHAFELCDYQWQLCAKQDMKGTNTFYQNNLLFLILAILFWTFAPFWSSSNRKQHTFWCVLGKRQILLEQNSKVQTSNIKLNKDTMCLLNLNRALLASYMNWILLVDDSTLWFGCLFFWSYLLNWMLLATALCSRSGSGGRMFGSM